MKKYSCPITFFLFILISNLNAQWIRQDVVPGFVAFDVRFINKSTGWVCGDTRIFKTTNSGLNWINQPNPAQDLLLQMHPVNDNVAYACGYCTILKTTNGGENWIGIRIGVLPCNEQTYSGLWFNDDLTGWFCARNGNVIRTIDGCKTLIDSFRVPEGLWDVHFKNNNIGVMVGGPTALRTTNAGVNWYPVPIPSMFVTPIIYSESFVGDSGWCISRSNVVYKTTNYGISWDSLTKLPIRG
jgi:photosystem II stability/assembly factor-like uncharacterized protein